MPAPQKKIAGLMLQTLAGDQNLAPRKAVFEQRPRRRRAEGTRAANAAAPQAGFCYRIAHERKTCPRSAGKKNEAASCSAFLHFSRGFPYFNWSSNERRDIFSFTAITRCGRPTWTTRPTVICGSRHAVARWTFATPRFRGVVVHLSFRQLCNSSFDIFHFLRLCI
jgi:hypothetical protein